MKLNFYESDGFGGFFGFSNSLSSGTRKNVTHNKFHIVLFVILLSGICKPSSSITTQVSLTLALQRSNEIYIKTSSLSHFINLPSGKSLYAHATCSPTYLSPVLYFVHITYCSYLVTSKPTRDQTLSMASPIQAIHAQPFPLTLYLLI